MSGRTRSPFGTFLREERRAQGISQAELARLIAERFDSDPSVADLGVISDRAIANIEAAKASPDEFVRPRAETIQVLMLALGIDPATERGQTMLRAARQTQRREILENGQSDDDYLTPFIHNGRQEQWDALQKAWITAKTGQPQIRLIEGTAGLGKTRMIEEFTRQLEQEPHDYLIAMGECSSGTATVEPYLPWRRAFSYVLRDSLRKPTRATPERIDYFASILLAGIGKLGDALIDLHDLEEWLKGRAPHRIPDLERIRDTWSPTNTIGRYDEFFSIVSAFSTERPVVIFLEDLHWADESSCSLLLHLQRQIRLQTDLPLLVIGTYRSSDLVHPETRHPLLQIINEMHRQVDSVIISLEESVSSESGRAFVEGMVQSLALDEDDRENLVNILFNRTQGHPLFTGELLRRLMETGAIARKHNGPWALDTDKIDIDLPHKMRAIIDERVQRLPDDARTVVEAASVQSSPFNVDIIPDITGLSARKVELIVDRELIEKHRIFRPGKGEDDHEFEFDHEIIAETVYQGLLPHRRRSLHKRTAEALLAANAEDPMSVAPRAAHHFEQANMLSEAAEQALLTSFSTLARLDHDLTLVWVDRSDRLARAANDDERLWSARIRRAHVLRGMGSLAEAYSIGLEGISTARRLGKKSLEAEAHEITALVEYDRGMLDEASGSWRHAIVLFEQLGRNDRVSAAHSMLSHVACRTGQLDSAIRHAQSAWAAAPNAKFDGLGAEALLAEGNAMIDLGRYADAIEIYERSLAAYTHTGEMRGVILCRMNIALGNVFGGNVELALEQLEQLLDELDRLNTPRLHTFAWLYQGRAFEAQNEWLKAKESFQNALEMRQSSSMDAMAGDELAGILRAAVHLDRDVEGHLERLQLWWRTNDYQALEDPMLAMYSLALAYEKLGNDRLMHITLNDGVRVFLDRADQIENPAIREMFLRGNRSGAILLEKAREAGLVEH